MLEITEILHVWVDADSCPRAVRRVLLRAAARLNEGPAPELLSCRIGRQFYLPFHFVAAKPQPIDGSSSKRLYFHQVAAGTDACDQFIQVHCLPGDIVITRDIVFAEKLCMEDGTIRVINDRGIEYSSENVSARRRRRDLALALRNSDLLPQIGASSYSAKDLQHFAACFDRCLTQQIQQQKKYQRNHSVIMGKRPEHIKWGPTHTVKEEEYGQTSL